LGDTAVAVHPEDDRSKNMFGKMVVVPIIGRVIPIITDEYVDRESAPALSKLHRHTIQTTIELV
jgi:valyl-tRNA synthetase